MEELQSLTKAERDAMFKPNSRESWVTPADMRALKVAVRENKEDVILGGNKYLITYGFRRTYPAVQETVDSIRLTRADGTFVPMGYFPISTIMKA